MSKILVALLCCVGINTHAMVMAPDQPSEATSNRHATHITRAKTGNTPAKPVSLPPASKASLGFYQASLGANYDMMDMYLQQGADINCLNCDSSYQMTALFRTLGINNNWNFQQADWLIQRGANINIPAKLNLVDGITSVMLASSVSNVPNLQALDNLVKRGANIKAIDATGRTALHWIREWSWIDNKDVGNKTSTEFIASVNLLVNNGIDINQQDNSGTSALMNATNYCSPGAVKLLIYHGANVALKDKQGKSALDFAIDRATQAGQGSLCNEVVKILSNSPLTSRVNLNTSSTKFKQNISRETDLNVGSYGGSYNGADEGVFQAEINQDGTATFKGHSNKIGITYTHSGKVNTDGSVTFLSAGSSVEFTGIVSRDGVLSGAWKNSSTGESGSFQGQKGVQVAIPSSNLLKAFGSLFK